MSSPCKATPAAPATIPTRWRTPISRRRVFCRTAPTSVSGAVSALISGIGSQAQQVNTAQTAQTAVNTQAQTAVQSIVRRQPRRGGRQSVAMAAGLSSLGASADDRQQPVRQPAGFGQSRIRGIYAMRITQGLEQTQFLTALNQLESNISQTQNEISTGLSFTTASQNPSPPASSATTTRCWRKASNTPPMATARRAASISRTVR